MYISHHPYHIGLRVSALITAFILVFDSGILVSATKQLSDNTYTYLANSVGVYATIPANELNTMSAALNERERELDAREAALRTIEARSFGSGVASSYSTYILSVVLFVLTLLIVTNYILDWRRVRMMHI